MHFVNAQLSYVTPTVTKLLPTYLLIVGGNPLHEVPAELFEIPANEYLDIRSTNISTLPGKLPRLPQKLTSINLDDTFIATFSELDR